MADARGRVEKSTRERWYEWLANAWRCGPGWTLRKLDRGLMNPSCFLKKRQPTIEVFYNFRFQRCQVLVSRRHPILNGGAAFGVMAQCFDEF